MEAVEDNTNYSLSLAGVAGTVAKDLAGDRPSTARALPTDGEVELHDYVGGADAVDTYRLEVLNGGYLDLSTDNRKADLNLTVWSDRNNNNLLDADEIVAQGTNEIQEDNINPGTYYVNVTAPGTATPYKISAISEPGSRVDIENYDPLFPGIPTTGTLTQNDDFDPNDEENYADPYLLPELGTGLTVTVTQESEDFDAYLTVVDLLTGEVVVENNDINTSGGDFNARVSFTTKQGGQYVVFASSVDAPGLGDYTLNATVTGTPVANPLPSASADTLLPPPVFTNRSEKPPETYNLTYAPLTGGKVSPIQIKDLNQNYFGDCAFIAALAATFGKIEDPSQAASKQSVILSNAITSDGNNYTLQFYNYVTGQPRAVTVDNQVVTYKDQVFGAKWYQDDLKPSQASGQPIWASIFERGYAKFRGEETGKNGYDAIGNGDNPAYALKRVTGKAIENIAWDPSEDAPQYSLIELSDDEAKKYNSLGTVTPDRIFQRIQDTLNQGRYVETGTKGGGDDTDTLYGDVLYQSHAYSVHNAYEKDGQKLILLRNPHGIDNAQDARAEEDPSDNLKDGFITIKFEEFLENFTVVSLSEP